MKGSTFKRCTCPEGRQCPKLEGRRHGVWYSDRRILTTAGQRSWKRGGFPTQTEAGNLLQHADDLIRLAGGDRKIEAKIGDLIFDRTRRGGQLPPVEDVRRRLGLRRDPGAPQAFGEAWDAWLAGKRKARPSYIKWLGEIGRNWLLPVIKDIQLDHVSGESCALVFSRIDDINEEIDLAREQGRAPNVPEDIRKAAKHVGVSTQHGIYRALRAFLNYQWKKAHAIPFNPVYMVELEPAAHVAPLTWSPEQVARFLGFHEDHRLIFLWRLALLRGFRRGELCGMADDDFDEEEATITVNAALLEIGGKLVWGKPKSRAGERVVDLDQDSVTAGKAHRTRRKRERLAAGEAWAEAGLMFTNELGEPLRPDQVSATFKELAAEAGLPVIKLHAARHTAASLALEAGIDIKVVSDQLGHSTTTITRDTYQHVRRAQHRDAAEKVVALLAPKDAARKAGS